MVNRKEELKKLLNFLIENKEVLLNFENEETFIKSVLETSKINGLIVKVKNNYV